MVLLELRATDAMKGKSVTVDLTRDDGYLSKNSVTFKAAPGGPDKYKLAGKLGFKVVLGKHRYTVKADVAGLALKAETVKNIPKPQLAAAEIELAKPGKPATAVATPAPTPPPAAIEATPVSDSATAATTTHEVNQMLMGSDAGSSDAATGAGDAKSTGALRVAVYDLEIQGVDPRVGAVVTDSLLAEVRKLQGVSAIGMAEIRDMLSLEASKQAMGCEANESCLAEIAGALGVDDLVTGSISKVGDGSVFILRRLDQRQAKIRGSVNKRLAAGAGDEFLLAIGPAVQELFTDRDLKPGKERGVPKEVALRINPPPLPKWSFFSVAGGSVAAAVVGSVFYLLASQQEDGLQSDLNRSDRTGETIAGADFMKEYRQADSRYNVATYGFATAGTLALSAAVMAFFTDWNDYAATEPAR